MDSKCLYCTEFLKEVYNKRHIINLDESGFSKSIKQNYSWLPRGRGSSIINEFFWGRANLVFAISNQGDMLGMITNQNVKSIDYWIFMIVLEKWLKAVKIDIEKNVVLIQD